MKILFDGSVFQFQRAGGINRYFAKIISGLSPSWEPVICGANAFGENVPQHPRLTLTNPPPFLSSAARKILLRYWARRVARGTQLLHPTYYNLAEGLSFEDFTCPIVVTVYDMIYARFPSQTDNADMITALQRQAVAKADRVICISRATERDLLEFIPEAAGRTEVIHLGVSSPAVIHKKEQLFERPTFLYLGARGGYKNFLFLLRCFAKAVSSDPRIRLNVAGPPLNSEERWQIFFLGLEDYITEIVFPNEARLADLFSESIALLYPSRYEGFGLPALEAMAQGTIPVAANNSSLPEVLGDGGIMLDPSDDAAWTDCILELAQDGVRYGALVEKGRRRARAFSWERCVAQHTKIYVDLHAA